MNVFHSKSVFISPTKLTYSANTIGYIVLYYNRFITLLTHIQEKKNPNPENTFNFTVL